MATARGNKGNTNTTIDASVSIATAATTVIAIVPTGFKGYLDIQNAIARVTTAFANLESNEVLTIQYTPSGGSAASVGIYNVAAATLAVGTLITFTAQTGYEQGINLSAGDQIDLVVTNADVTADAGVVDVCLPVDLHRL